MLHGDLNAAARELGIGITRLQPRIGAEIRGVDLRQPLAEPLRDLIYALLVRYRVIFFRNQDITQEQHLALGRAFGELEVHPLQVGDAVLKSRYAEIIPVRQEASKLGGPEDLTANRWHTDMTQRPEPPLAAILRGVKVPTLGGDTLWACAVAAYEGLNAKIKERIENLVAEHDLMPNLNAFFKGDEEKRAKIASASPPQLHPVVRIHPDTAERILFVNSAITTRIVGLEPTESAELLQQLFAQFTRPEYQVRFKWEPNSIAFWDERSTQHYAAQGFEGVDERHMERVTIIGQRPIGASELAPQLSRASP
jgi:alpha-ketoglutarate-dependent taurine dioxygenase